MPPLHASQPFSRHSQHRLLTSLPCPALPWIVLLPCREEEEEEGAAEEQQAEDGEGAGGSSREGTPAAAAAQAGSKRGGKGGKEGGAGTGLEVGGADVDMEKYQCQATITVPVSAPKLLMRETVERLAAETNVRGIPGAGPCV